MYTWKVEDHHLLDTARFPDTSRMTFPDAETTSYEDMLKFVDDMNDGIATYCLDLYKKWVDEYPKLKKNQWGDVQTNSLKAWLRRNDPRNIFNREYVNYGTGRIIGSTRHIEHLNDGYRGAWDTYDDLVQELFHRTLIRCYNQEKKYKEEHDPYMIKTLRVIDYLDMYHSVPFSTNVGWSSKKRVLIYDDNDHTKYREATEDELNTMIANFEGLENYIMMMRNGTTFKY